MKDKILHQMSNNSLSDVFKAVNSSEQGLSKKEAHDRLETFGLNEVVYEKNKAWYTYLFKAFLDPFILSQWICKGCCHSNRK